MGRGYSSSSQPVLRAPQDMFNVSITKLLDIRQYILKMILTIKTIDRYHSSLLLTYDLCNPLPERVRAFRIASPVS